MNWLRYPELVESARAHYDREDPKHVLMVLEPGWRHLRLHPMGEGMKLIGYATGSQLMGTVMKNEDGGLEKIPGLLEREEILVIQEGCFIHRYHDMRDAIISGRVRRDLPGCRIEYKIKATMWIVIQGNYLMEELHKHFTIINIIPKEMKIMERVTDEEIRRN